MRASPACARYPTDSHPARRIEDGLGFGVTAGPAQAQFLKPKRERKEPRAGQGPQLHQQPLHGGLVQLTAFRPQEAENDLLIIGGTPVQVFSPTRGDVDRVTACDFVSLLPTDDQIAALAPGPRNARHLGLRREALSDDCPTGA